jgi:hypothetical protein
MEYIMNEYRVTRPAAYGPGSAGHTDTSARQGYYVWAEAEGDAKDDIRERLDLPPSEPLDVELWDSPAEPWYTLEEYSSV